MKRRRGFAAGAAAVLATAAVFAPRPAAAAEPERGRALYESRCASCHAESVHARKKRVAKDYGEVRAWVARWNANLGLGWGETEVEDVTAWLNARYYRYPCPPDACRAVSRAEAGAVLARSR